MTAPAILTFFIADIRGYTSFTAKHGDEAAARLAAAFAEIVREGVEAHAGEVVELRGDEALAVFSSPRQALRAAVALQQVLADEVELHPDLPLHVGIGLDAGEAVPVEGGYRGAALNVAARLCSQAAGGQVLASESVVHLAGTVDGVRVDDGGEVTLKGLDHPAQIKIVSSPDGRPARPPDAHDSGPSELPPQLDAATPITGARSMDARRLRWWWRQARAGSGGLALISGPAGMGKTRIATEAALVAAEDGAFVSYFSGEADGVVSALADVADGQSGPALLVVDDLDGSDSALRESLAKVADRARRRAVLLVACSTDGHDPALTRAAGDHVVHLAPLDRSSVAEIVALYAPDAAAPPVDAILQASGGVPAQVHRLTNQWAQAEATQRLAAAATRASEGRSGLRTLETDLADNVIELQFARERALLYGAAEGSKLVDGSRESPFKGLAPFETEDADVFFGRERLIAEMIGRLAGASLLGVVGRARRAAAGTRGGHPAH
jgi:class 3 adenylate cyclase